MAKLTIVFGVLLVVLGVAGFVMTGSSHPTSLIPCWFGLVLALSGGLASGNDAKKRMLWMHIAVTVGLLGFLFPAVMSIKSLVKAHAQQVELAHPAAVHEQLIMAFVCLIFVVLCVRSFIAARRGRVA
ncbi:hypothetical protein [Granulicella mallensis]|uniref:Transmembrane protein n=1 Tax=Granulicella mallensis TaxID=940614 RepID=A0A7W8EAC1_9BACT|nr:hypothetical protein [Granulicella mallensis]MBB5065478.1 hypothetical protein [Granulicella mallensis]